MKIITNSEQGTYNFAKNYAGKLKGGEIIGLVGELGAGKTVFTKGLASGLGIKKTITSPTFILMKVYPVTGHKRIKQLVHVDAYRIARAEELAGVGIKEYFNREDTVIVIEWADKAKSILSKNAKIFKLIQKNNNRIINYAKT